MTQVPALTPTVSMPTVERSKPTDLQSYALDRRRTSTQFPDQLMPESKAQRLHRKQAREDWRFFDGVACDHCRKEIPPLNPHLSSHGEYCSDRCYQLAGGHIRGMMEERFGVTY
jgi:hypothetical protein